MNLSIINKGLITYSDDQSIAENGSTVTMLEENGLRILVDAGHIRDKSRILKKLEQHNAPPESIDAVIYTHLHLDHASNAALFPDAVHYFHHLERNHGLFPANKRNPIYQETPVTRTIRIIETPGHTTGSISVIFKYEGSIHVCVGDALLNRTYLAHGIPSPAYGSMSDERASIIRIVSLADVIIPGHGTPFEKIWKGKNMSFLKDAFVPLHDTPDL